MSKQDPILKFLGRSRIDDPEAEEGHTVLEVKFCKDGTETKA
jgi:hypothetical protein